MPSRHTVVAIWTDTYRVTTQSDCNTRRHLPRTSTHFELHAQALVAGIDVLLESFVDRWVATVADGRRSEIGLGSTARSALTAAIESLAPTAAGELLTDPELFAVSWRIRQAG
jgi:hypothetical protein